MRVLFLDFDGVLNSHGYISEVTNHRAEWSESAEFDPKTITLLNQVLAQNPDLRIVISSSWRILRSTEKLTEMLEGVGLTKGRVIDRTPDRSEKGYARGYEIQDWLDANPGVTAFVILDDDADMEHLSPHHVKTSYRTGLLARHLPLVQAILDGRSNP